MTNNHYRLSTDCSKSTNNCFVIFDISISVQFDEIIADQINIVECLWSIGMS
ncbi:Uncharacterised protein [Mycobacterium tuberculosis]|nr:Uncharacterised protein [Mycobacterium tuberculosis]